MTRTFRSFAKINLHLEVLGKRDDGFHELRTIFQSVDFCDLLTIEPTGERVLLEIEGEGVPEGEENLAFRAALLYLKRWAPGSGVKLELRKRIPLGGGLGGGSSNAATVLKGMRQIFGEPKSAADLHELARDLGADVAFFLVGGTALGTGRGDEIAPLEDLREREIWLATPPVSISTAQIFADYDRLTAQGRISSMGTLALGERIGWQVVERGRNDLEPVALRAYPVLQELYNALVRAGAREVRLTGSGATLVAWFDDSHRGAGLPVELSVDSRIVRTRTLTRASFQRLQVVE